MIASVRSLRATAIDLGKYQGMINHLSVLDNPFDILFRVCIGKGMKIYVGYQRDNRLALVVLSTTLDYISGQSHTWKALYNGDTRDKPGMA